MNRIPPFFGNALISLGWLVNVGGMRIPSRTCLFAALLGASALLIFGYEKANAAFSGPYDLLPFPPNTFGGFHPVNAFGETAAFGDWEFTSSGNGAFQQAFVFASPPDSLTLQTGAPLGVNTSNFLSMQIVHTAVEAGFLSFDYDLSIGNHFTDAGYYLVNGMTVLLPPGSASINGVWLDQGDVFGFGVNAGEAVIMQGIPSFSTLTITAFSAPVPEPSVWILAIGGVICWRGLRSFKRTLLFSRNW